MLTNLTLHHYLLAFAAVLSVFNTIHVLFQKRNGSSLPLICVLAAANLWTLSAVIETVVDGVEAKSFWLNVSQTGFTWLPLAWFVFILQFVYKEKWKRPRQIFLLSAVPVISVVLLWTHPIHRLYWGQLHFEPLQTFIHLQTEVSTLGFASLLYGNLLALASVFILVKGFSTSQGQPRMQKAILLLCTLLPWTAHLISLLVPIQAPLQIPVLILFNISGLMFAAALFQLRLMNSLLIPFESMIDGMRDGILVLNTAGEVIHANLAAAAIAGSSVEGLLGKPIQSTLVGQGELVEKCLNQNKERLEQISIFFNGQLNYYELHCLPLFDRFNAPAGRIITLHSLARRFQMEAASREVQRQLKQSEEKYRSLVENINEVIFTIDPAGIITYISPVIQRDYGYALNDVIGWHYKNIVHPEDYPRLANGWNNSLIGNFDVLEFRILDRAGSVRYVRTSLRPILQDGKPVGLQGVLTDITDRKRAEDALQRRALQLSILNDIGEKIASVIELDLVLDSATQLIQEHFGYYHLAIFTPDHSTFELVMRSTSGAFTQVFPKNHRLKYGQGMVGWAAENKEMARANDVLKDTRYTNLFPEKIRTRSELAVPILIGEEMAGVLDVQSPIENAFDDNDVLVMRTVADQIAIAIENARLYEEVRQQLKERERKESMMRIQRDLLVRLGSAKGMKETLQVTVDSLGAELHASQVTISLVDWDCHHIQPVVSGGAAAGQENYPLPLESSIAGWVARYAQPALISDISQESRLPRVSPGTVSLLCLPLISNGKVIGVISLESSALNAFSQDDLRMMTTIANSLVVLIERAKLFEEVESARSELEKRAAELEEANANLRELDRIKSQFLANMSHELRTPLNSIIGFSELMIDQITGEMNEDQMECAQDIHESGLHLLALINDLLDFSKIEAGRMELEPTTFEVDSLFAQLRITLNPLIEKKSQVLEIYKDGAVPPLTADHLRLKQVFINLLSNANKFTPEGGTIKLACQLVEADQVLFSVTDSGIGIRSEDHELIFEEFRQVDGSLTRKVSGTGLGLAISRRIVELHHGKIWVESTLGEGATFFVLLPVKFQGNTN